MSSAVNGFDHYLPGDWMCRLLLQIGKCTGNELLNTSDSFQYFMWAPFNKIEIYFAEGKMRAFVSN